MAKPQLGDLALELDVLTWSEVISMSVQLKVEFADLRKIDESTSPSIRVLTAMDLWLKTDTKASWKKVVRALRAIKKDVLAQTLEEKYCRATPAPPPPSGSGAVSTDGASLGSPAATPTASYSDVATPQAAAAQGLLSEMHEALIPAQNSSHFLGLKLGLPPHAVQAIHSQNQHPKDCLLQVLTEFLQQVDPDQAWRAVVAALRSRSVNLPRLAIEIENKYYSPPSSPPSSSSYLSSLISPSGAEQECSATRPSLTKVTPTSPPNGPAKYELPTLPKLMRFPKKSGGVINIITCIGANHRTFGIFLLNDERGDITDAMFQSELGRPDAIIQKIFMRWLQGTGREPRSWGTLVTVLEEMGVMDELASTVRENLREK